MTSYQLSMNQLTNEPIDEFLQDKRRSRANKQPASSIQQPATSNQQPASSIQHPASSNQLINSRKQMAKRTNNLTQNQIDHSHQKYGLSTLHHGS
jgi:hypothetical protein